MPRRTSKVSTRSAASVTTSSKAVISVPAGGLSEAARARHESGDQARETNSGIAAHFDIDASVVFQLGEHLISDVIQALVELVKNAYDADASFVKVTVDTESRAPDGSRYHNAVGFVSVEDDGHGMGRSDIENGWLV